MYKHRPITHGLLQAKSFKADLELRLLENWIYLSMARFGSRRSSRCCPRRSLRWVLQQSDSPPSIAGGVKELRLDGNQ